MSDDTILLYTIFAGILSIVYGFVTGSSILNASAGNARMQEIASAIQIGAKAYLNRQYKTIAIVGVVVLVIISFAFSLLVGIGYLIGAALSGIAGYVGMLVSVQANVRTAEASRKGLSQGLSIAFKSGAITGMLVAGLALLAIAVYYYILLSAGVDERTIVATIVTAYVSKRSAAIPAQSPTLSPTLSAITAGFLGSSSGIPASTFPTKSAPTSAPFVKIPPPNLAKIDIKEAPKPKATNAFTISLSSTPADNKM